MFKTIAIRLGQGHRTTKFPDEMPALPDRFRGRPALDPSKCPPDCRKCADSCPTQAIVVAPALKLDLGRCLFCTECVEACPEGAVKQTKEFRLATSKRDDLVISGADLKLAESMSAELKRVLGRALRLREVCAGSCAACDLDTNVLNTIGWDLSRFGIQFVASPRHADGLVVTGAISQNMVHALKETYDAVPPPKIVIAVGACAISGGPFRDSPAVRNGLEGILPIDLYIPGCPPHPVTILDGLLRLIGRIPGAKK